MKRVFNVYGDPGHSWIKVKKEFIIKLGIYRLITPHSYDRGDYLYLEEDCDGFLFTNKLKEKGIEFKLKEFHTDKTSRIRGYNSFMAPGVIV